MEKKIWPWKRRSSADRNLVESESSGSFSSQSGRFSDDHDALKENRPSLEVMSNALTGDEEVKEGMKNLMDKLSAALVNVNAKEDLVMQHAKVAEEAVAGWEKAQDEVAALKHQLEEAMQKNFNLEARVSHLDGALKECVHQLRQARDEQDQRVLDALAEKDREWLSTKAELERRIREDLITENSDPKTALVVELLEKEKLSLQQELMSRCNELELMKVERDLSTKAAEAASKLQLEGVKKVVKLEAEYRRLQSVTRKSSSCYNPKPVFSSFSCAESLTDSHSDSGDKLNAVDGYARVSELSGSDSWALALITELDQFKKDKSRFKNLAPLLEFDMMDDFLEMERLAALPELKSNGALVVSEPASMESLSLENLLKDEMDSLIQHAAELEKKLEKAEAEKLELESALNECRTALKVAWTRTAEVEANVGELQNELCVTIKAKEQLESQLIRMEAEARTVSANMDSLKAEIEKERTSSAEPRFKFREMENELARKAEEVEEIQRSSDSDSKPKVKQEDLAVAANKLAECQKTIASLGRQLKSLATLEDFLVDTASIPGLNQGQLAPHNSGSSIQPTSNEVPSNFKDSLQDSNPPKGRNGFGKLFTRSKSVKEQSKSVQCRNLIVEEHA